MLRPSDFTEFFQAVHGYEPFPWQSRLAAHVAASGWPDVIAAPTGSGKTSTLDVAVFELARQATNDSLRTAPLRVFNIVDRRIVVDSTFLHARVIARQIAHARGGILRTVADALRSISGDETPLVVARLRGGTWRDDSWIRSPVQPTVVVSTVDQVGSRLLYRGYGVSTRQRSLHAALVGVDALFLVDEAHLSRPFVSTVRQIQNLASRAEIDSAKPLSLVEMTATPTSTEGDSFGLDDADNSHPVLQKRLSCNKLARLVRVAVAKDDSKATRQEKMVEAAVAESLIFAGLRKAKRNRKPVGPQAQLVGLVVNRVATARGIFAQLSERDDCDCLLLTGRVRPFERDQLLKEWLPRIRAGREESSGRPLFVVATQCIEVGADLDFDALVTEVAPLDSLRQRFGRVDRLGRRGQSSAVILARSDTITKNADDPIYGGALGATWKWLQGALGADKQIDFGIAATSLPPVKELVDLLAPSETAPRLRREDLEALACTSVSLAHGPDLPLFLHGRRDNPDVNIVWRDDLPERWDSADKQAAVDTVALLPPTAIEALSLPIYVARAWLRGEFADTTDVEGGRPPKENQQASRPAIRWRGDESTLITARDLEPGDTIVVPSTYGGCDGYGWNPGSSEPVTDIADRCAWLTRWKPVCRVSRTNFPTEWLSDENPRAISQAALDEVLPTLSNCPEPLCTRQHRAAPIPYPNGTGWLIESRRRIAPPGEDTQPLVEEASSISGREVDLHEHCAGVAKLAVELASKAGLPTNVIEALEAAGQLHDIGKIDPRFQSWLHCGDEIAAALRLLAKSAISPRNRHLYRAARRASGLPEGWRHEMLSVQLAEQHCSSELTLHLISAHHGGGRPFHQPGLDLEPPEISLTEHAGSAFSMSAEQRTPIELAGLQDRVASRFADLQRHYGWWGLSYLESFLILADWRQTAAEKSKPTVTSIAQS